MPQMGKDDRKKQSKHGLQRSLPEQPHPGSLYRACDMPLWNPLDVPKHPDFFVPVPANPATTQPFAPRIPRPVASMENSDLVCPERLRSRLEEDRASTKKLRVTENESEDRFIASQVNRNQGKSEIFDIGDDYVLFAEPVSGYLPLMFEPMSLDDCRRAESHSKVAWVQPMTFAIYDPPSNPPQPRLYGEVIAFDQEGFKARFSRNVDVKGQKRFLLQVFVEAAATTLPPRLRVNILFVLVMTAKHAAYVLKEEESFARALLLYVDAIRQLHYPSTLLDLVWFAQESGHAFESASLHPNRSKESVAQMRHGAARAFKMALVDAHSHPELLQLDPGRLASLWSACGVALEIAGDSAMAIRAYHWGLLLYGSYSEDHRLDLIARLGDARRRARMGPEEREAAIMEWMQEQYANCKDYQVMKFGDKTRVCAVCAEAAILQCSRCRTPGLYYCCRECQCSHWKEHKRECKPRESKRAN